MKDYLMMGWCFFLFLFLVSSVTLADESDSTIRNKIRSIDAQKTLEETEYGQNFIGTHIITPEDKAVFYLDYREGFVWLCFAHKSSNKYCVETSISFARLNNDGSFSPIVNWYSTALGNAVTELLSQNGYKEGGVYQE